MPAVADLVEPTRLADLATPATLRLAREIVAAGAVELLEVGALRVRGKVGGRVANSQARTTELRSAGAHLQWSCTCSRDTTRFCKHCAALAIAVWDMRRPSWWTVCEMSQKSLSCHNGSRRPSC